MHEIPVDHVAEVRLARGQNVPDAETLQFRDEVVRVLQPQPRQLHVHNLQLQQTEMLSLIQKYLKFETAMKNKCPPPSNYVIILVTISIFNLHIFLTPSS